MIRNLFQNRASRNANRIGLVPPAALLSALTIAALIGAGCGGGGSDDNQNNPTPTPSPSPIASPSPVESPSPLPTGPITGFIDNNDYQAESGSHIDFYEATGKEAATALIEANVSGSSLDPFIAVLRPNASGTLQVLAFDRDNGAGFNAQADFTVSAGEKYLVLIGSETNDLGSYTAVFSDKLTDVHVTTVPPNFNASLLRSRLKSAKSRASSPVASPVQ